MKMPSTRAALITAALATAALAGAASAGQQPSGATAGGGMRAGTMMGGAMMRADTDHDGRISRAEYMAAVDARFTRLDQRGDGQLTAEEMHPKRGAAPEAGQGAPSNSGAAAGSMPTGETKHMKRIDTDHDGTISRDEYRARAGQRFDRIDANHDGYLDQSEIEAARDAVGGHRGGRRMPAPAQ